MDKLAIVLLLIYERRGSFDTPFKLERYYSPAWMEIGVGLNLESFTIQ